MRRLRRVHWFAVLLFNMALVTQLGGQVLDVPASSLKVNIEQATTPDLARADEFLAAGQWDEAVETIRRVSENEGTKLFAWDDVGGAAEQSYIRYVPVRRICHWRLAQALASAPEALALYRSRVDPLARQWYEQAVARRDEPLLRRLVEQLFASRYGDDALLQLGEYSLERGDFARARGYWEQISPQLRTPAGLAPPAGGQPLWLRLRGSQFDECWVQLEPMFAATHGSAAWLAYPDTDLNLSNVRARLVLVSILEGSLPRALVELEVLRRLHPDAEGRIAGRQGRYVDLLSALVDQSSTWPAAAEPADWPTFGGAATRNGRAIRAVDPTGSPRWTVELAPLEAAIDVVGMGRPRIAENADGLLSYHPLIAGDLVLWSDADSICAHKLETDAKVWGVVGKETGWRIFPAEATRSGRIEDELSFRQQPRQVGVPRFTLTVDHDRLFARLGDPVTASRDDDEKRMKRQRSYLVGLDLSRQGRLLAGFPLEPDGLRWEFEGAPVADGSRLYVAMRHSTAAGAMPELHVACFELPTIAGDHVRRAWRVKVCSADTPAGSRWHEITHCLLTLNESTLYCNTNMGAVAAISADEGQIEWLVQYPRAPLRPTNPDANDWHYYRDLNPSLCFKDLVIVAPEDCDRIFALDCSTGQVRWECPLVDAVHLLGVGADHLIASGTYLYWVDVHSGMRVAQVPRPGGRLADGLAQAEPAGYGRGILAGELVYWPTRDEILVFKQQPALRQTASGAWISAAQMVRAIQLNRPDVAASGGNLVIGDGVLLIAAADRLWAFGERPVAAGSTKTKVGLHWPATKE